MTNLQTTTYSSVSDINANYWSTINPIKNTYFSPDFLMAFENSNPNIKFKYIIVKNNLEALAIALVQTIELNVDVILKNIRLPKFLRRFLYSLFCNDHIHIMFCGNIFLSGEHGILINPEANKNNVIKAIGLELNTIAKQTKPLHAIFVKDFIEDSRQYTDQLENHGFIPMHVEPNMIIALDKNWESFDDYKKALKSKYRVKVNKADKTSSKLEVRLFTETDFATYKDELQKLYENTIANANFNAQVLNLNTYIALRKTYQENFIVKAYFLEGKLVGFLSALANNHHLDAHFIGLDYSLNKECAIYPRILNDYVRLGIEKKASYINFGRTASEIKTTVGATPTELTCYIKHKRPFINTLIRPFIKRIQIKEFKQHFPFKTKKEAI